MKKFIEKLRRFVLENIFIIICEIALLLMLIIFRKGSLFLGGEANYFLDTSILFDFNGYTWKSLESAGYPNPLLNYCFPIFLFMAGLGKSGISYSLINLILVFIVYSSPLISMYWLSKKIFKLNSFCSTLISLAYIANPFSVAHLQGMMFWNAAPLAFLPIFFGVLFLNYRSNINLFVFSGISFFVAAFSFANIPYLGIFQIFIVISLFIIPFLKNEQVRSRDFFSRLLIVELSFLLFSAWWFINLARIQVQDLSEVYTKSFAVNWAKSASGNGMLHKIISFRALIPSEKGDRFSDFYNNWFVNIIMFLPAFLLVVYSFIVEKNLKFKRKLLVLVPILLLIIFLNKGVNEPLAFLYVWMLKNIPFFMIFKSPLEKFSLLYLFFFTLTILVIYSSAKKKKLFNFLFIIYIMVGILPYITLNFMPDFSIGLDKFVSRKFIFKDEYKKVIDRINGDNLYYRYMSLPGSLNYQVTMSNLDGKYYRGMDPILYAINKPFVAAYSGSQFKVLYKNLSNENIESLMGVFSIRKILLNPDIIPSFGFSEQQSSEQLKSLFSKKFKNEQFNNLGIYTLNSYVPLVYSPTRQIHINKNIIDPEYSFSKMITSEFKFGSVIIPDNDNQEEEEIIDLAEENRPDIEFRKISEVKYRIVIHKLKREVPLVFNESFHKGWKLYQSDTISQNDLSSKYSSSGREDSASQEEIEKFLSQKILSRTMAENGKSNFISKSFNKTIQNDNLAKGEFYENWFQPSVGDHIKVNGYANSWIINPEKLCNDSNKCTKNADGSYDTELTVEFLPQRLFYIGAAISGLTLFTCLFLLANYIRRKRLSENC